MCIASTPEEFDKVYDDYFDSNLWLYNLILRGDEFIMKTIDLSGVWNAIADNTNGEGVWCKWYKKGLPDCALIPRIHQTQLNYIVLPGTTDDAHIGIPFQKTEVLSLGLDRAYEWNKDVWLERIITLTSQEASKQITLSFERTMWHSLLWVNGKSMGEEHSAATPHKYDLTGCMNAGDNRITIRLRVQRPQGFNGHHFTPGNGAQGWNGIIGGIGLTISEPILPCNLQCYPDLQGDCVAVKASISQAESYNAEIIITDSSTGAVVGSQSFSATGDLNCNVAMKKYICWDEFCPQLYICTLIVSDGTRTEKVSTTFGMRQFTVVGTQIALNGHSLLLRGTHEGCQFPLHATPPMDVDTWVQAMTAAKEYGMNHLRFHSWCPPEAAFVAADRLGVYLQVEMGGGHNTELPRILDAFGNHPSFMSLTLGNELFNHNDNGDFAEFLTQRWGNNDTCDTVSSKNMLRMAKQYDSRHLYCCTSHPIAQQACVDDYYVSAWGRNQKPTVGIRWAGGDVQTATRFNTAPPETASDYREALEGVEKPIISHEVGQWLVYPDLSEYSKYTGTLRNWNYELIKEHLRDKHLLDKAALFTQASGRLSVALYEEEIESALRTPGFGGFALLDLRDYPGQGIATIGILNAFWESKGTVTPERFREFNSPAVPLLRLEKRTYTTVETLCATVEFANYSFKDIFAQEICVKLQIGDNCVAEQTLAPTQISSGGLTKLGKVSFALDSITAPVECCIHVEIDEQYRNHWNIWVYPQATDTPVPAKVKYATQLEEEVLQALQEGQTVLLCPASSNYSDARPGCFTSEFWTPHNKPVPPARTLGLYVDTDSEAFAAFPTAFHSDWQWWDVVMHSYAAVLDDLTYTLTPLVGVIDNFDTNQRLGSLLECRVGRGKLMVCCFDLKTDILSRPVAAQLKRSLYDYLESDAFSPKTEVTPQMLQKTFGIRNGKDARYCRS